MQPNLVGLIIGVVGTIVTVGVAVGLPALAIIAIKYFKFRERELTLEMEYRHQSQQKGLDIEQRVQRLEDALSSLDHDVRMRLGIGRSQVSHSGIVKTAGLLPGGPGKRFESDQRRRHRRRDGNRSSATGALSRGRLREPKSRAPSSTAAITCWTSPASLAFPPPAWWCRPWRSTGQASHTEPSTACAGHGFSRHGDRDSPARSHVAVIHATRRARSSFVSAAMTWS